MNNQDFDRYLKVVRWAAARYKDEEGTLVLSRGRHPSRYTKIETLAKAKYLGLP